MYIYADILTTDTKLRFEFQIHVRDRGILKMKGLPNSLC